MWAFFRGTNYYKSHLFLGFEWYNKHGFRSKLPLGNLVGRETMELKDALTI